jgi:hypothetical protein
MIPRSKREQLQSPFHSACALLVNHETPNALIRTSDLSRIQIGQQKRPWMTNPASWWIVDYPKVI